MYKILFKVKLVEKNLEIVNKKFIDIVKTFPKILYTFFEFLKIASFNYLYFEIKKK